MLKFLLKLFRSGPETNYKEMLANGAQVIDVRTAGEFKSGHIKGSINIPLSELQNKLSKIDKEEAGDYVLRIRNEKRIS